ncbi:cytochrome c biogenesis protein ResB [Spelaeicoccus albus]|uniref:Cytochrome c biogenesis protein n=1 Tax=Spelaeicoccus albus TaxID=1280376 RepID=A0A7Z0IJF8_9MICO|nr:cytochrome c biogenesis protein ResB [Spelaeicoccus albus]NYI69381.1 cytochrome c biogenesis protein [Spelaeicoccus albus]
MSDPHGPEDRRDEYGAVGTLERSKREAAQPKLGFFGWIRWAWRQLTTMRVALFLLLMLALAAVPASVFPQRVQDPTAVADYIDAHGQIGRIMDKLQLFDVNSSVWFSAIYILLLVSLVGCILPRTKVHWRALRADPPKAPRRLSRMPAHVPARDVQVDEQTALSAAAAALKRRGYRVKTNSDHVAAERGYLRETGNLVFHIAVLGVVVTAAIGGMLSYSGQRILVEGDTFNDSLPAYDSFTKGTYFNPDRLPKYSVKLDKFDATFDTTSSGNQAGEPRSFVGHVTTREDGQTKKQLLKVNDPLHLGGANLYLSGNGYAPVVTVKDGTGHTVYSGPTVFLPQNGNYVSRGVVKAPDAAPKQLGFVGVFFPTAGEDKATGTATSIFAGLANPVLLLSGYSGDLGLDNGTAQSVYSLDPTNMTEMTTAGGKPLTVQLKPGQSKKLPNGLGSVRFDGVKRYVSMDVRADPSKMYVLVFALLGMLGLGGSLFVPRRRIWVRVAAADDGSSVEVAGLARGEDNRLNGEVDLVAKSVLTRLGHDPAAAEDESLGDRRPGEGDKGE